MGPITGSLWDPKRGPYIKPNNRFLGVPKRGPEFGISTKDNSGTSGPTLPPYRILGVPFSKGGDPIYT